jgi:hypothetical protein
MESQWISGGREFVLFSVRGFNYAVDTVCKQFNVGAYEKAESGSEPHRQKSRDDEQDPRSSILAPTAGWGTA